MPYRKKKLKKTVEFVVNYVGQGHSSSEPLQRFKSSGFVSGYSSFST